MVLKSYVVPGLETFWFGQIMAAYIGTGQKSAKRIDL